MSLNTTRQQYPINKKLILKNTLFITLVIFFMLMIATIGTYLNPSLGVTFPQFIAIILFLPQAIAQSFIFNSGVLSAVYLSILAFIITLPYQALYYRTYNYQITDDQVIIKTGVLSSTEISMPFERMQDVYINQNALDRLLKIYTLNFSTAASSMRNTRICGLDQSSAETLQKLALTQIKTKLNK